MKPTYARFVGGPYDRDIQPCSHGSRQLILVKPEPQVGRVDVSIWTNPETRPTMVKYVRYTRRCGTDRNNMFVYDYDPTGDT